MKSLTDQITSVRREIALRQRVFPKLVLRGKMSPKNSQHEIECMQSVLATLEQEARVRVDAQPDLLVEDREPIRLQNHNPPN